MGTSLKGQRQLISDQMERSYIVVICVQIEAVRSGIELVHPLEKCKDGVILILENRPAALCVIKPSG